jgi:uncharacterized protein YbjT (DUF2867 family)
MSRVLVTGATGNVGSEVSRLLAERGVHVRHSSRRLNPAYEGEQVRFDFEQPETFGPALEGVDRVFLVRPPALSDVARHVFPFVDAAKQAGISQIVFLSLLGAEQVPFVPHRKIEHHVEASGIPHVFLRASFFMQNLSTTHAKEIRERDAIDLPAGSGKTSFIDVRDIAEVAAKALSEPVDGSSKPDLTGEEALDYHEVARMLSETLGRPITYREASLPGFLYRRLREGIPLGYALVMGAIYTTARMGQAGLIRPDLRDLLGRPPRNLRQFLSDHREAWS